MNTTPLIQTVLPPRLTMDEYVDFLESSQRESNPVFTARQKNIEKRVLEPFCLNRKSTLVTLIKPSEGAA